MKYLALLCWVGVLVCIVGASLADNSPAEAWFFSGFWFLVSFVMIGAAYAARYQ